MKTFERAFRKNIDYQILSVAVSILSFVLVVLLCILLPWDEIRAYISAKMLYSSLTLLSYICIIFSVLAEVLSIIVRIRSKTKLKQERERLDTMLSYIMLINKGQSLNSNTLEKSINTEVLMRKEYEYILKLYELTNDKRTEQLEQDDVEVALDNARDALKKLKEIS